MIASDGTDLLLRPASQRGRLKVYIGMSAGVGKSYRMLEEAHRLLGQGINIQVGYIETHGRAETHALLIGLPVIPRRRPRRADLVSDRGIDVGGGEHRPA